MENKEKIDIKNDENYKELTINKMVINGKEQGSNLIPANMTKGKHEINVTVYTQEIESVQKTKKGHLSIRELLKTHVFHNRRS